MSQIRAVVVDPSQATRLVVAEVEAPEPQPNQALVRVKTISLNRGEVRGAQTSAAGARPGWDFAGVVEAVAADGSGPRAGERVVGLLNGGAWAELVAAPTANLAVLPESISFSLAATLPVAGLTALYALDRANGLLERRVLVTGASGGVGLVAVQLAAHGGARVTGLVRQAKYIDSVEEAGAEVVIADEHGDTLKDYGPFDLALESVGGQVLANVIAAMSPDGLIVTYGISSGGPVSFDPGLVYRKRLRIEGQMVFSDIEKESAASGLTRLVRLVDAGVLRPLISVEAPWSEVGEVSRQLMARSYAGKAVLLVE